MASNDTYPRLLGDIGGTNARFAWQAHAGAALSDIATYPAKDHPTLLDAMQRYLREHGKPQARWCAIGIANPVTGDHIQMTNHHWSFSISAVQAALGAERFLVVNDFTALALALPLLGADERYQVGGGEAIANAPIGLVGPGTGLGVSGLLPMPQGRGMLPLGGEGGHVSLAGADDYEDEIIRLLRHRYGHASAERALSGPGLVALYEAVCTQAGANPQARTADEITAAAVAGSDVHCVQTEALFYALLGGVAGNLALSLGARGGMYVGGGIVPRLGQRIAASNFRTRFEKKGRFEDYLRAIPVFVVKAAVSPALVGASQALDNL
ncbi:MAG TPA: glucokinase [Rhizobacter sp.]|nr:glucokinase [Rhizobacter sp.]